MESGFTGVPIQSWLNNTSVRDSKLGVSGSTTLVAIDGWAKLSAELTPLNNITPRRDEESMYDYDDPGFDHETGHFTQ